MTRAIAIVSLEMFESLAALLEERDLPHSAAYCREVAALAIPIPDDGQDGAKWRRTIELLFRSGELKS